jgi:calcineurin-like phosphoesterase family protein
MAFVSKFYTADTHFCHAGMLTFGGRPFSSTDEMDRYLVDQWNNVVRPDDVVYHLGDFCCGDRDQAKIKRIFNELHGRKYLVLGNHDVRPDGKIHPAIANLGWAAPPSAMLDVRDEGERVILCHYSMRVWPASHHASWHFYGHSHGSLPPHGRSRDVGVDCVDVAFTPRTFKELVAGMSGEIAA